MKKKVNKYFLGGTANQLGSSISGAVGAGANTSQQVGNLAQAATGAATGNPMDVISGGIGALTGSITSGIDVFKNEDATAKDKIFAALGMVNPLVGGLVADNVAQRSADKASFKNDLMERNKMLGLAYGGPVGTNIKELGGVTNIDGGFTHDDVNNNNIHEGVPLINTPGKIKEVAEKGESILSYLDNNNNPSKYIFTNNLVLTKDMIDSSRLPSKYKGKTMAEVSKSLNKELEERPYDTVSKETSTELLNELMKLNELARKSKILEDEIEYRCGGKMYYKGGKIQEGEFDVDDMSEEEIKYLNSLGYDIEIS